MKKITFEIADDIAARFESTLAEYFAAQHTGELAEAYRDAGLSNLARFALFEFIKIVDGRDKSDGDSRKEKI